MRIRPMARRTYLSNDQPISLSLRSCRAWTYSLRCAWSRSFTQTISPPPTCCLPLRLRVVQQQAGSGGSRWGCTATLHIGVFQSVRHTSARELSSGGPCYFRVPEDRHRREVIYRPLADLPAHSSHRSSPSRSLRATAVQQREQKSKEAWSNCMMLNTLIQLGNVHLQQSCGTCRNVTRRDSQPAGRRLESCVAAQ